MSFIVLNGTNREWTTTEEADLSSDYGVMTPGVACTVFENFAVLSDEQNREGFLDVILWAIGDNLYVAHHAFSNKIYWSNSLKDAFDFGAEAIAQSSSYQE